MLIDWFTVGAQALNFLILVWLMKRFLYKPILLAIDARERRIAAALADAEAQKTAAKKEQDEFRRKNEDFDAERATLLRKATGQAKAEGERLLDAAHKAADSMSAKRVAALQSDAQGLNEALTRRTQEVVFQVIRKALFDLATTSLEARLGEVFTRRLREMSSETKAHLAQALKTTAEPAVVRSAFELPASERAVLQNALKETFCAEVPVQFEVAPNVISGIQLSCGGQKIGWSIEDYLASLEQGVTDLLNARTQVTPTHAAGAAAPKSATGSA
jgi:F-type H+-transporting ATPase subunit b